MNHTKDNKPSYQLSRVNENQECEPTENVMLAYSPTSNAMNRRAGIGTGIITAVALMFLNSFATTATAAGESKTGTGAPAALPAHSGFVSFIHISPDGKLLASGGDDQTIKLWSLPDGILIKTLEGHKGLISSLHISPDGKLLISGSFDKTIKLWSLPDGALIKTLEGHKSRIRSIQMSPDGKLLASGNWDNTTELWSLPDGALIKTLKGHKGPIFSIHISPDGKLLASTSKDKTIRLWSLTDGKFISFLADMTLAQNGKRNDPNRDK